MTSLSSLVAYFTCRY